MVGSNNNDYYYYFLCFSFLLWAILFIAGIIIRI